MWAFAAFVIIISLEIESFWILDQTNDLTMRFWPLNTAFRRCIDRALTQWTNWWINCVASGYTFFYWFIDGFSFFEVYQGSYTAQTYLLERGLRSVVQISTDIFQKRICQRWATSGKVVLLVSFQLHYLFLCRWYNQEMQTHNNPSSKCFNSKSSRVRDLGWIYVHLWVKTLFRGFPENSLEEPPLSSEW